MKFILITWNIAGLPYFFNFSGTSVEKGERIFEKIDEYLCNTDKLVVIHLQELFDSKLSEKIIKLCKSKSYCNIYPSQKANRFFGLNSGLMTISNMPVESHNFLAYTESYGEDSFANKGILSIKINDIWFVNTHLQNDNVMIGLKETAKNSLLHQINQFKDFYDVINDNNNKSLVAGDFNISIKELVKKMEIEHFWESNEPTIHHSKPDLIFANFLPKKSDIEIVYHDNLSDHKMVLLSGLL